MTVLVKKEWLKTYSRTERLGGVRSINWGSVSRYGWLLAVAFITVFFFIWQHVQIIREGYEIERLKGKLSGLQTQNSLLTVEAASLEDLYVMEQRAALELGMVKPAPGQIIYTRRNSNGSAHGQPEKSVAPLGR